MDYGREILDRVHTMQGDVGGLKANVDNLRREFDRAREESSDRYDQAVERLEGQLERLSEESDKRKDELSAEVAGLRDIVSRCPQHAESDAPLVRIRKPAEDSGRMKAARRGVLKSLGLLFGALATAVSGWWASQRH